MLACWWTNYRLGTLGHLGLGTTMTAEVVLVIIAVVWYLAIYTISELTRVLS